MIGGIICTLLVAFYCKWEGWMGKYLPQGHGARTSLRSVDREPNIFPSGPT